MRSLLTDFLMAAPAIALLATPVLSHDRWANGDPVPPAVKAACCGPADARLLRQDEISDESDGYHIRGIVSPVPHNELQPSPDGRWWVFARAYADGSPPFRAYCLFGPMTF